jgi:deoxyadenosine/deoxycytidine kinase
MNHIAVSGVHGIGKTTLASKISRNNDFIFIEEQARKLLDTKYYFKDVNSSLSVFMDFQNEVLDNQIDLLLKYKDNSFVTDRTPIDSLAYVIERLGAERYLYSYFYESYMRRINSIMKEIDFDTIYFLNFDVDYKCFWKGKIDNQRNLSPMYMLSLNEIMLNSYGTTFKTSVKVIESILSLEEREKYL